MVLEIVIGKINHIDVHNYRISLLLFTINVLLFIIFVCSCCDPKVHSNFHNKIQALSVTYDSEKQSLVVLVRVLVIRV